jgi:hypothetical protein
LISGVKLVKDAIEATSDTRGARADFVELSRSLASLDRALNSVSALKLDVEGLNETVDNCRKCFLKFLVDIAKFRILNEEYATKGRVCTNIRKIQWALCKKEDVRKFRAEVDAHIKSLEMMLLTYQV